MNSSSNFLAIKVENSFGLLKKHSGGFSDLDRLCLSNMVFKISTLSYDKLRSIYGSSHGAYLDTKIPIFKDALMVGAARHNNMNNHHPKLTDHGSYAKNNEKMVSVSKIEVNGSILRPWSLYYKFNGGGAYKNGQWVHDDQFDFSRPQPYMQKLLVQISNAKWTGDPETQTLLINTYLYNPVSAGAKYLGNPNISSAWCWLEYTKGLLDDPDWCKIESLKNIPRHQFDRRVPTFAEIPVKSLAHFPEMPADETFTKMAIWIDALGFCGDVKITPVYDTMKL
jgi:hypothetical protein